MSSHPKDISFRQLVQVGNILILLGALDNVSTRPTQHLSGVWYASEGVCGAIHIVDAEVISTRRNQDC